ncbi:MAG TPA: PilT/PilU family type 4a pilus ATPase [Vicinamibacterales bacterium]|nr:PilT/PilU family type 4a pilus ATPase [Vicinamibacterales bacterium]
MISPDDDERDLDRLVSELNASDLHAARDVAKLQAWLAALRAAGGSDLYLVAGVPPSIRVNGVVRSLTGALLDGDEIEESILPALPPHAVERYRRSGAADASFRRDAGGRFRINLHRERGRAAASIRALPLHPPQLGELALPPSVEALTRLPYGLVLVGGPTGSGKSTTVAALVDAINRRDAKHIVTIEDPIEYEHPHHRSIVEQVEIGIDAPDFVTALRSAVRQSPDVIVVGEMRDPETMRMALAAGETGHLVFSTLHTSDVASTISRVSDAFPPERQTSIRQELSMALAAVMTQALLPKAGGGRIPAAELLMVGYGARQHIRKNALQHLHQEITITRGNGSFTFEECLAQLVRRGVLNIEDARARSVHRDELDGLLTALPAARSPLRAEP